MRARTHEGWLFKGYENKPIRAVVCNEVFQKLCSDAKIKSENGKRLSFHCCRMWFSTQLRNKVSDEIIDLLTGHALRFGGAYLGDAEKIKVLKEANVADSLKWQATLSNGLRKDVAELMAKIETQNARIQALETELKMHEVTPEEHKEAEEIYEKQVEERANQSVSPFIDELNKLKKELAELKKAKR